MDLDIKTTIVEQAAKAKQAAKKLALLSSAEKTRHCTLWPMLSKPKHLPS